MATLTDVSTNVLYIGGSTTVTDKFTIKFGVPIAGLTDYDFKTYEGESITEYSGSSDAHHDPYPFLLIPSNTSLSLQNIFNSSYDTSTSYTWGNTTATYAITPNTGLLYSMDIGTSDGSHYIKFLEIYNSSTSYSFPNNGSGDVYLNLSPGQGANFTGNDQHCIAIIKQSIDGRLLRTTDAWADGTGAVLTGAYKCLIKIY